MVSWRHTQRRLLESFLKRFRLTLVFASAIILALGYFLIIEPQLTSIREIGTSNLRAKQEERAQKEEIFNQLRQARESFRKITASEVERLSTILPAERDLPSLFLQIETLASSVGLRVTSLDVSEQGALAAATPSASGTTANVQKLNVAVQIDGLQSYEQLKAFLANVEQHMRLIDISSLSYSPATTAYALNLTTYYVK